MSDLHQDDQPAFADATAMLSKASFPRCRFTNIDSIPHAAQSERFPSGAASAPRFFHSGLTPKNRGADAQWRSLWENILSGTALAAGF